eukprot:403373166
MMLMKMKVTVEADESFFKNLTYADTDTMKMKQKSQVQVPQRQVTEQQPPQQNINITNYFDPRNITRVITTPQLKHQQDINSSHYLDDKRKALMKSFNHSKKLYNEIYQGTQNSIGDHIILNPERERIRENAQKSRLYEETRCYEIAHRLKDCLNGSSQQTLRQQNTKNNSNNYCEDQQYDYLYCMS